VNGDLRNDCYNVLAILRSGAYEGTRQGRKKLTLKGVQTIVAVQLPCSVVLPWLKTTCRCLASMSCSLVRGNQQYVMRRFLMPFNYTYGGQVVGSQNFVSHVENDHKLQLRQA
jgi:hypothetical protein